MERVKNCAATGVHGGIGKYLGLIKVPSPPPKKKARAPPGRGGLFGRGNRFGPPLTARMIPRWRDGTLTIYHKYRGSFVLGSIKNKLSIAPGYRTVEYEHVDDVAGVAKMFEDAEAEAEEAVDVMEIDRA